MGQLISRQKKKTKAKKNTNNLNLGVVTYDEKAVATDDVSDHFRAKRDVFIASLVLQEREQSENGSDYNDHLTQRLFDHCALQGVFGDTGVFGRSAVCLRTGDTFAIFDGDTNVAIPNLETYVEALDMEVAIFIDHPVAADFSAHLLIKNVQPDGHTLQVFDNLSQLARARLNQPTAFFREEKLFVVWSQDAKRCLELARSVREGILHIVWNDEKEDFISINEIEAAEGEADIEAATPAKTLRQRLLVIPIYVLVALIVAGAFFGFLLQAIIREYRYDGSVIRFAYVAYFPIVFIMSLFFVLVLIGSVWQLIDPMDTSRRNTFAYSATPPQRITGPLPHMTILCPVYKESLSAVIEPTVASVKAAMRRYQRQGGSCNLVICDDRMQLVDEDSQNFRKEYYRKENIGWVGRPGHNHDGYIRAGRFKKASNMNAMMGVSVKVEERLENIERPGGWTPADEERVYKEILEDVLAQDGRLWGEGNIRLGELILIIDSDTRVPGDCLLDAASEFEQSAHLAILQHASGVMHVSLDYFENGMSFFTDHIYRSIRFSCAGGDMAPFVGHNAFIRWAAVQSSAEWTHEDGNPRWWSESHVSEDFEMALKLQCAGHSIRLAAYTHGEFKEGVSLTALDELARWEKYAYGCSEMVLNPVRKWIFRGPFTPLFRKFLWAKNIPVFAKFTLLSYIGTYYAFGAVWIFALANYFWTGWAANMIDQVYQDSFSILISQLVVFFALAPISGAVLTSKMRDGPFWRQLYNSIKWMPFFAIFFSGVSLRVSMSLLSHMFEYNMQWGATGKEVNETTFIREAKNILREFKWTYLFFGLQIPMMIYLGIFAPYQWKINGINSCLPLALVIGGHLILPVALNAKLLKI
ncbi:hypothetical protein G7K_2277-t1 [Saitoella complicata NRRL Y-17804]|uniref:Uncharacterized protein n=2 Tax=Saitoella complicata (strain BCRC 22490 / CBS 7301 / JCM 7358 / NBRC 10748 / NRRL Y-17804) TaxID=698492 RepID=A0A0E9NFA4_SAICN|nr:hypothetical protein G7K_2277-t1 [Saitoella complicata NRRL Y-17804]